MPRRTLLAAVLLVAPVTLPGRAAAQAAAQPARSAVDSSRLAHSIRQLRESLGGWTVETRFLNPDGSIAQRVQGTYRFDWVVPDRVIVGSSAIPSLGTASGILFYVSEERGVIEMVSVGADGRLWAMTGELGGEERQTPPFTIAGGGERRLRFTRYPIRPDSFESRMHYSDDGGKTWVPGNHQVFRRSAAGPG